MEKQNNLPIKDWATEDRPREKMAAKGAGALSKAELLAILIGSGTPEKSAVALMQEVMKSCGDSLKVLGGYSAHELQAFKGIGPAKAITILAAMELVKRRMTEETDEKKKICSSTDIYDIMLPEMKGLPHEEFWVIILNRSNRIIERRMISKGGISATVADVRLILRAAILAYGSGIIVCHNHPSGNMQPSAEDNKLTMKIKNAAAQMDMALLDHIIITEHGYYSYADEGAL